MNKAIIKAVLELESKYLAGVINLSLFNKELDILLGIAPDEKTKQFILLKKDRDI